MLAGQEICGAMLSITVSWKEQFWEFPEASVAVKKRVWVPNGSRLPGFGDWVTKIELFAVQLSATTAEPT
jgi:hypothetical protein